MQHAPRAPDRLGTAPASVATGAPRPLSLALQGGGSFGAFTWGVLDRLLEDDGLEIDAISGASAGAVNAVLLADGLADGGPAQARTKLTRFWERLATATPLARFGPLVESAAATATSTALMLSSQIVSPYQFNPLGLDPLRRLLGDLVDFERLRARPSPRLLIAATRVRDGQLRVFREHEVTRDAVLASACLPQVQQAVEIDGEAYWDGGYSANPPIRQLVLDGEADDILLVQLTPEARDEVPHRSRDIARRVAEIGFASPLRHELASLAAMTELCRDGMVGDSALCARLQRLRLHRVAAADHVAGLADAHPFNTDWGFIQGLKQDGRAAAQAWLAAAAGAVAPPHAGT